MDPRSVPWWRHTGDKQCQLHSVRTVPRTSPRPLQFRITEACQRAPRSETTMGWGRGRLSTSPHTGSPAASAPGHKRVPSRYTEQKPWSHQWLPISHPWANSVCSTFEILTCPESHFSLPLLPLPGPVTITSVWTITVASSLGWQLPVLPHAHSVYGAPVKTKPVRIPPPLRALPWLLLTA